MERGDPAPRPAALGGRPVIVVGAGIGGLTTALSLHEVGAPVEVFESVRAVRALGVGINLLPHAVRELDAMGLLDRLREHAIEPQSLLYCSRDGQEIWREARGLAAGYPWPQLSIHRGVLQTVLLDAFLERIGPDHLHLGHRLVDVVTEGDQATARFRTADETGPPDAGADLRVSGAAVVGADGIHSVTRAGQYPHEGEPRWNGSLLWRGIAEIEPVLDGRTMVWAGHRDQKFVGYPIADLPDGRQQFNFIAELRRPASALGADEDWNRAGDLDDFLPEFEDWRFDWLDVPAIIRAAPGTYLFPMVDRDPVGRWTDGRSTLLGDAAHPMYPIGSNGASQAILDARVLAGCVASHGDVRDALVHYETVRLPPTAAIVEANRGLGPEVPMQLVHERAPDGFDDIDAVISRAEIDEVTAGYRTTAGFALAALQDDPRSLIDHDRASTISPAVAPDGSPVELYLRFPGDDTARRIDAAVPPSSSVLDLGCGVGRIAGGLVRAGHRVTGVDNSPEMLRHAARRGVETVEAELVGLDLGRSFEVVLLLSHFVNEADEALRHQFWDAAARHVSAGGSVVVERFTPEWVRTVEPSRQISHDVEIEVHDVDHEGDVLHAGITYRIEGRSWTQTFSVVALDDDALAEDADRHGLVFERVLDDRGELVLLRSTDVG